MSAVLRAIADIEQPAADVGKVRDLMLGHFIIVAACTNDRFLRRIATEKTARLQQILRRECAQRKKRIHSSGSEP